MRNLSFINKYLTENRHAPWTYVFYFLHENDVGLFFYHYPEIP